MRPHPGPRHAAPERRFTGQNAQIAAELAELQEEVAENTKSIEEQTGVRPPRRLF